MFGSYTLFEIRGVPIRVHITTLLLLYWLSTLGAPLWLTLLLLLLILGSIILHELGHTLVAQRYGIPVQDILLTPIGGVARLRTTPADPRQEVRIALAGPLVSLALVVLSAVLLGLGVVLPLPLLAELARVTCRINLVLLVFNLLPNFPMDGGRVLRARLTPRKGRLEATRIAAEIGKYVSGTFILLGILLPQHRSLVFIGIFMLLSAGTEYRLLLLKSVNDPSLADDADFQAGPPPYARTDNARSGLWSDILLTIRDLCDETCRTARFF